MPAVSNPAWKIPAMAVKFLNDAANRGNESVAIQPSFPEGAAMGSSAGVGAASAASATGVPPNLIVIGGKAVDLRTQCGLVKGEQGEAAVLCVGEAGLVVAGVLLARAAS